MRPVGVVPIMFRFLSFILLFVSITNYKLTGNFIQCLYSIFIDFAYHKIDNGSAIIDSCVVFSAIQAHIIIQENVFPYNKIIATYIRRYATWHISY